MKARAEGKRGEARQDEAEAKQNSGKARRDETRRGEDAAEAADEAAGRLVGGVCSALLCVYVCVRSYLLCFICLSYFY